MRAILQEAGRHVLKIVNGWLLPLVIIAILSSCSPTELRNDMHGGLHEIPRGASISSVSLIDSADSAGVWCLVWVRGKDGETIQLEAGRRSGTRNPRSRSLFHSVRYRTLDRLTIPRLTDKEIILTGESPRSMGYSGSPDVMIVGYVDKEAVWPKLKIRGDWRTGRLVQEVMSSRVAFCWYKSPSAYIR
jgi:hypothetical protein